MLTSPLGHRLQEKKTSLVSATMHPYFRSSISSTFTCVQTERKSTYVYNYLLCLDSPTYDYKGFICFSTYYANHDGNNSLSTLPTIQLILLNSPPFSKQITMVINEDAIHLPVHLLKPPSSSLSIAQPTTTGLFNA